jgi:hypothetical protein
VREELRLLNALVGMANGAPGWPNQLRHTGFRLTALQRDVGVGGSGTLPAGVVTPEAVFQSTSMNESLLVESKSTTFVERQARRYLNVDVGNLVNAGAIKEPEDPQLHVVSPMYFCAQSHAELLSASIVDFNNEHGTDLPLVTYDHQEMRLLHGAVRSPYLDALFRGGIAFDQNCWPHRLVPCDAESPIADISAEVLPVVTVLLLDPEAEAFTAEDVGSTAFALWNEFAVATRTRLKQAINQVLESLRQTLLDNYIAHEGPQAWRKKRSVNGRGVGALRDRLDNFQRALDLGTPIPSLTGAEVLGQLDIEDPL